MSKNNIILKNCSEEALKAASAVQVVLTTAGGEDKFLDPLARELAKGLVYAYAENKNLRIFKTAAAWSHVHVLMANCENLADVLNDMKAYVAAGLKKAYPELGKKVFGLIIVLVVFSDEHYTNCVSYLSRHLPDNSKPAS